MIFTDRNHAGRMLGEKLNHFADRSDVVVLGLARGGVPVGSEVARSLHAPLDVFIVRKLGLPGREELAMGAIASGGVVVLNDDVIGSARIDPATLQACARMEHAELLRREKAYRVGRRALPVSDKVCILVDDGIATGASMRAAATAVLRMKPKSLIVAAPVVSPVVFSQFAPITDAVVCVLAPNDFSAVGSWYENFDQISDEEVAYYMNLGVGIVGPWNPSIDDSQPFSR